MSKSLTVLSFGGAQDSTAILYHLYYNQFEFREYAPGDYVVVMSDTGDEHPKTYAHVKRVQAWCKTHGIEFHLLTPAQGFHSDKWPDLRGFYNRTKTCGSKAFPKTCTDNLKVQVIYRWLSRWVADKYNLNDWGKWKGKQPLVEFAEQYGKIKMLIGIAAGEETRVASGGPRWMETAIERHYPLIKWAWDRGDCQHYISGGGHPVPPPSNCMLCPFMSKQELLWLFRHYPDDYHAWVQIESNKMDEHWDKGDKNLGVWGTKDLPTVLKEAIAEFGHMTNAELDEYKMSHGHCVASKY